MGIRSNLAHADAVLTYVNRNMGQDDTYWLEGYQSGWENGYALSLGDRMVAFSEYRKSDQIVVYTGHVIDFAMAGNVPSNRVEENATFFDCGEAEAAADLIIQYLEQDH